jgi:hypothetical protein
MLVPNTPVPNIERQRQFRERNPGYYQRLHAKRRAVIKARIAEARALAAQPLALPAASEPLALPAMPVRLALPAPVETPLFIAPPQRERELVPVFEEINSFDTIPSLHDNEPRP